MPSNVIYARKSTESEDRQIASIESQITELKRTAEHRGIQVDEILTESRSAKAPGRPVFSEIFKRVRRGEISGILAWKMDRLARNHLDTGMVLQALADGQLERVITVDREYTCDGNDRFIGNFELGMATKYIDDLRQNVRRGNRARFERGWINHIPPLGYHLDPVTKTIVEDPERFDLVRRMWDLALSGSVRPGQILRIANEQWGLRTRQFKHRGGGPVPRSTVYDILSNPFYAGLIVLRSGETFHGAHPPMVSKAEFDHVQALLHQNSRPRPQKHDFAYSGLFSCGICGCRITAEEHVKPSGRRYIYYRCTHRSAAIRCSEPAITEADLESQMLQLLSHLTMPEKVFAFLAEGNRRQLDQEQELRGSVRQAIQNSLAGVRREQEALLDLRLRDMVTDEQFVTKRKALEERRLHLDATLDQGDRALEPVPRQIEGVFLLAQRAVHVFRNGDRVQKRGILRAVGLNWQLRARKVLTELKKPFQIMSGAASLSNWSTCADDIRTWLIQTGDYFVLPDELLLEELQPKYQNQRKRQGGRTPTS